MLRKWTKLHISVVCLKDIEVIKGAIPTKITECIGVNLPIVLASPYSDAAAIIENNNFGRVVEAESPRELASTLLDLFENRNKLEEICDSMINRKLNFTRRTQAYKLYKNIEDIVYHKGNNK